MNIITGSFVEKTMRYAQEHHRAHICKQLWEIFKADTDLDDIECLDQPINRTEFEEKLYEPEMIKYLDELGLTPHDALRLDFFDLIDLDGSGTVDMEELIDSCVKLAGTAKAVHIEKSMLEFLVSVKEVHAGVAEIARELASSHRTHDSTSSTMSMGSMFSDRLSSGHFSASGWIKRQNSGSQSFSRTSSGKSSFRKRASFLG